MSMVAAESLAQATTSGLTACLEVILRELGWRGTPRQLAEATGLRSPRDMTDLRNAMANLGFASRVSEKRLRDLDPRLMPFLFLHGDRALVVLGAGANPGRLRCFDGRAGEIIDIEDTALRGISCFFTHETREQTAPRERWLSHLLYRFEGRFLRLLGLSFVINLLALTPAIFVQAVYDNVLPTQNITTLMFFAGGVVIALTSDMLLRSLRAAALAQIGGRIDFLIGTSVVNKLLSLPLARLDKLPLGTRVAQIREFESLRQAFVGPLVLSLLDMPFLLLFVAALGFIGGWLALVPIVLVLVIMALGFAIIRYARGAIARAATTQNDYQAVLVEILSNLGAIKSGASEAIWLERFRDRSSKYAFANLAHARVSSMTENIAYAINMLAGASTLAIGALLALEGRITMGALIASMTLVWRMLAPAQALFVTLTRIHQIRGAAERLNQLMVQPSEPGSLTATSPASRGRRFAGRVSFQRVLFRYENHYEPALSNLSFDINPGEIVAITGGNGSGKSTILKLLAAFHHVQMGAVMIDGIDTRQMSPTDLRQWVAYLPQQSDIFSGTIRDNLRIAHPTATDAELYNAARRAGLERDLAELPDHLDSMVDDHTPSGFARKLTLARTFLLDASIILLDEPGSMTDSTGEDIVIEQLNALRGRATVIMTTHHLHQIRAADRALVLRQGTLVHDGTPQELVAKLSGDAR